MKNLFIILCVFLFTMINFAQDTVGPTANGQFINQQANCQDMTYSTKLQVNITDWPNSVELENIKIRFTFNTDALEFWNAEVLNFVAPNYTTQTYLSSDGKKIWIEFELVDGYSGYLVGTDFVDFAQFNFTILDCNGFSNLCLFSAHNFTMVGLNGNATIGDWPCDESPLPVELTSFTAQAVNNKVTLKWSTATELNNQGFEIERNGKVIGFISGNGTSTSPHAYTYVDIVSGTEFKYRLRQIDYDGSVSYSNEVYVSLVSDFVLLQNYPNPFNGNTKITYQINNPSDVNLTVYDILGREVQVLVNERQDYGTYSTDFHSDKASACFIYSLTINGQSIQKKMIVLK